jgi:hypothetical protein
MESSLLGLAILTSTAWHAGKGAAMITLLLTAGFSIWMRFRADDSPEPVFSLIGAAFIVFLMLLCVLANLNAYLDGVR